MAVHGIHNVVLQLACWLKTICKRSGAGVWNFDINCLTFSGLGMEHRPGPLFLAWRRWDQSFIQAMGDGALPNGGKAPGEGVWGILKAFMCIGYRLWGAFPSVCVDYPICINAAKLCKCIRVFLLCSEHDCV